MQKELKAWWQKCERKRLTQHNCDEHTEISSGHGRVETRISQQLLIDQSWLGKDYHWPGLTSIIKVRAEIHDK